LLDLPGAMVGASEVADDHSLACRDLIRGRALNLPSGEAVARYLNATVLTPEQVGLRQFGWSNETPLWYYVLKEAQVLTNGEYLGPVGGRIVAEVLCALIDHDPGSYRKADPDWTPAFAQAGSQGFTAADMIRHALAPAVQDLTSA
jgi:hypothetical protein